MSGAKFVESPLPLTSVEEMLPFHEELGAGLRQERWWRAQLLCAAWLVVTWDYDSAWSCASVAGNAGTRELLRQWIAQ